MADVPSVLLLASASSAARGHGEEEDPSGQWRADGWPDPGHAATLVCGGRGGRQGKTHHAGLFNRFFSSSITRAEAVEIIGTSFNLCVL